MTSTGMRDAGRDRSTPTADLGRDLGSTPRGVPHWCRLRRSLLSDCGGVRRRTRLRTRRLPRAGDWLPGRGTSRMRLARRDLVRRLRRVHIDGRLGDDSYEAPMTPDELTTRARQRCSRHLPASGVCHLCFRAELEEMLLEEKANHTGYLLAR